MEFSANKISRGAFEANLSEKLNDSAFLQDIMPLLPSIISSAYEPLADIEHLRDKVIRFLP